MSTRLADFSRCKPSWFAARHYEMSGRSGESSWVDHMRILLLKLITQRELVSSRIRADLLTRAGEFGIQLADVSITHLTFGKVRSLVSLPHTSPLILF